jgi:Animal haem peroxidase
VTVIGEHRDAVLTAQLRALGDAVNSGTSDSISTALTRLMRHGGIYTLLDYDVMAARVTQLAAAGKPARAVGAAGTGIDVVDLLTTVSATVTSFFSHLINAEACPVPSSLMSYLTFPHEGVTFADGAAEQADPARFESPDIPAAFTFVGQFVDHDLTMNAVNLFEPQTGVVVDQASPLIDLDSVYGPRSVLTSPPETIFDGPRFRLARPFPDVVDLTRGAPEPGTGIRHAVIADARNDENQLILQIHLTLMRLHNKLVDAGHPFEDARHRTILNWQSVLLHDYLPRVIEPRVLRHVLAALAHEPFGDLRHKPLKDLATGRYRLSMPHEFAIGFRFGHSQLRRAYKLNSGAAVRLFDNSLGQVAGPDGFADLRGGQLLRPEHRIDWSVFLSGPAPTKSNAIDDKVTSAVFDLPESAVPDDIKYIGNLPHRNLIRSRQVGLAAGEDLARLYGVAPLTPAQVEPDAGRRHLFSEDGSFRTPLWYYLLKEAQQAAPPGQHPRTLGPAGSHLVAEVVAGGIRFADVSWWTAGDPAHWSIRAGQPHPERVTLTDLVNYV